MIETIPGLTQAQRQAQRIITLCGWRQCAGPERK